MKPFADVDVLDLTQSIAGPVATQFLATLGANVVKVEPPEGDAFRGLLDGAMFSSVNLGGKRSVCLDLKTDEGRDAAARLAVEADVVVESFRPGVVEKFDLDYESVSASNEDVVYCSITGFGQEGPYRDFPAYDPIVQALTGLMSMNGWPDEPPVRIGASLIDWGTGTTAAFLVASALHERLRTGAGEFIDVNLFEVASAWMGYWYSSYVSTGEVPMRSGQGLSGLAPNEVFYAAGDKPFYLSAITDTFYERLCKALDRDDLATDERFVTNELRCENIETLRDELSEEFAQYDRAELMDRLAVAGVPVGALQTADEVVEDDPHLEARGMLTDSYNHWLDTPTKTANPPFTTTSGRPTFDENPPARGEHTRAVLAELGYSAEQIKRMLEAGTAGPKEDD